MARCGCGSSTSCQCVVQGDGSTTSVAGDGSAGSPYVVSATGTAAITSVTDTDSVDLTLTGSALSADVLLSGDAGNATIFGTDGAVFTPAADGSETVLQGSNTIVVSGTGTTIDPYILEALDAVDALNAQTGTTYTFALTDLGKFVSFNNGSPVAVTVPPNSSVAFPVGAKVRGAQLGAGQVTFGPGSGVTLLAAPGLKIAAQYDEYAMIKLATDTWLITGRLSA